MASSLRLQQSITQQVLTQLYILGICGDNLFLILQARSNCPFWIYFCALARNLSFETQIAPSLFKIVVAAALSSATCPGALENYVNDQQRYHKTAPEMYQQNKIKSMTYARPKAFRTFQELFVGSQAAGVVSFHWRMVDGHDNGPQYSSAGVSGVKRKQRGSV
jgi:hypothetical protein